MIHCAKTDLQKEMYIVELANNSKIFSATFSNCTAPTAILMIPVACSVMFMNAIALDRFLAVVFNIKYVNLMKKVQLKWVVLVTWLCGCIPTLYSFFGISEPDFLSRMRDEKHPECNTTKYEESKIQDPYSREIVNSDRYTVCRLDCELYVKPAHYFFVGFGYFLPLLTCIIGFYVKIYAISKKHIQRDKANLGLGYTKKRTSSGITSKTSFSDRGSHRDSVSPTTPCKNNSLTIYDDATTSVMGHEDGASFGPGYGNNYSSQNYANSTSYKANNNYQKCQNSNTMPKIFTQDYENGKDSIVSRDKITTTESGPFESSITKVTKHCSTSSYNNMFNNSQPFHQENSFQNSYVGCSSERATKSNDCNH